LPNELVLVRHPIADSSKWTAPRHAKFLLQLDVRGEPPFEVLPRASFIIDETGAGFHSFDVTLQHLMNQPFLTTETVIKLASQSPFLPQKLKPKYPAKLTADRRAPLKDSNK
jgi:hypothetical protein